tara:strand:+ start:4055 stop:5665 length:1611 start_codon:yes stop_codon:yes gene_type:complete
MATTGFTVNLRGQLRTPETPAFLPKHERAYLERIALGDLVIRGAWKDLFVGLKRTLYRHREVENSLGEINRIITSPNFPKMACRAIADLVLHEEPVFNFDDDGDDGTAGPSAEQWRLIDRASALPRNLWQGVYTQQFRGGLAWWEAVKSADGTVRVLLRNAAECFITSEVEADGTAASVERRRVIAIDGSGTQKRHFLFIEKHTARLIERRAHEILNRGKTLDATPTPLDQLFPLAPPADVEQTGVDVPLLMFISGPMVGGVSGDCVADMHTPIADMMAEPRPSWMSGGVGDDDMLMLIDAVVFAYSNLVQAIARFGDPKLTGPMPEGETDGEAPIQSTHDYIGSDESEKIRYIQWNAQLDSAFKLFTETVSALFIQLEINPRLVGLRSDQSAPDAWRKLLLESLPTQARVKRTNLFWGPGLERMADTALKLRAVGSLFTPAMATVTMRGGIPEPLPDKVDRLASEVQAELTDEITARESLHGADRAQVVTERIEEQRRGATQRQRDAAFAAFGPNPLDEPPTIETEDESIESEAA